MPARKLDNHPRRFELTKELHARPFMPVGVPGRALLVAFKEERHAQERDPEADRAHLLSFIERHGGPHPAPGDSHHIGDFDRFILKWERHTEFVSYMLVEEGEGEGLFEATLAEHLPADWLAEAPGKVVAAVEIEVMRFADLAAAEEAVSRGRLAREFSRESLAMARVIDGAALAIGDFRIHEGGFSRFALLVHQDVGARRIGRAVQRLVEIENYRMLAMLALPIARSLAGRLNQIDRELTSLLARVADREDTVTEQAILDALTALSAEIEALSASTAFRFGAARAYEAIVHERVQMMREDRLVGRQLFSEFMLRRFDPAMRTVRATETRLEGLATRASRTADLLRTRVDVALQAQNQDLLTSMDRRAALQLRLQETVEGLSVVAISYYAVSLAGYFLAPLEEIFDIPEAFLKAIAALPIILLVWWFVRRIRKRVARQGE
ncbi:MAG: DUF3422 domain-containing protein [Pseudomonadota bacterium]